MLCAMCLPLFDGSVIARAENTWEPETLQPSHDIHSLSRSADSSCHTCNLLLSQIEPKDVAQLRRDLDVLAVTSSQQLRICVIGRQTLRLWAKCVALQNTRNFRSECAGYTEIGNLLIQPAEKDYTNAIRSDGHWNRSDSTIAQITRWLGHAYITSTYPPSRNVRNTVSSGVTGCRTRMLQKCPKACLYTWPRSPKASALRT